MMLSKHSESTSNLRSPGSAQSFDDGITKLLPSCLRCKKLRTKCDTLIPSCKQCQKAKVSCLFYDTALQQELPRTYVQSLLKRLDQLKEDKAAAQGLVDIGRADGSETFTWAAIDPVLIMQSETKSPSFDVHCSIEIGNTPTLRFFGSSSTIALTVELLNQTPDLLESKMDRKCFVATSKALRPSYNQVDYNKLLRRDALSPLMKIYFSSLNLIYPFIDESMVESDLESVLAGQYPETPGSSILTGELGYQYFRIVMVCANACAVKSRHEAEYVYLGNAYYSEALRHVEEVTSEQSAESLQSLLLLIEYCLFYPQKGDIWKLLDFACRLTVELGYHREPTDSLENVQDQPSKQLRRACFWSLYTIERIVGQLFGRASDQPEPIITTDYPLYNSRPVDDNSACQLMSATHHHRLVYLRSELYRYMYLPTIAPRDNIQWFQGQFNIISQWHEDFDFETCTPGVSTITCTVAFHATVIFLFQPLVLQALSMKDGMAISEDFSSMPSDNYYSACKLIQTYEEIIHGPENSYLGNYPMTFMSAHYIYLAGLTLMAHCLIRLNSCVKALPPWAKGSPVVSDGPDYSNIFTSSNSCLVLLTWCAGQWSGMSGMLDTYKRLSESLLPRLMKSMPFQ